MKRFYSRTTGCTYLEGVHTLFPSDAVAISEDRYASVIGNPTPGMVREHDADNLPILVEPLPLDEAALAAQERSWRDTAIDRVLWLRERHRDELDLARSTTLTDAQFKELLTYVQVMRDWPQALAFPNREYRPLTPAFIFERGDES
ncbi:phage tail protein [Pseudomonas entomophila]|uniref:phage tail protein n=1 Tax=Pseudomonas entomophila TaxID=312306 RepID=UPI0023D8608B|nr:phage tail protein [Pseudomonas entomophila]MDF0730551.1 phage tail protein [Pseudomonas entomophila]